jgi:hypothetical protein
MQLHTLTGNGRSTSVSDVVTSEVEHSEPMSGGQALSQSTCRREATEGGREEKADRQTGTTRKTETQAHKETEA